MSVTTTQLISLAQKQPQTISQLKGRTAVFQLNTIYKTCLWAIWPEGLSSLTHCLGHWERIQEIYYSDEPWTRSWKWMKWIHKGCDQLKMAWRTHGISEQPEYMGAGEPGERELSASVFTTWHLVVRRDALWGKNPMRMGTWSLRALWASFKCSRAESRWEEGGLHREQGKCSQIWTPRVFPSLLIDWAASWADFIGFRWC